MHLYRTYVICFFLAPFNFILSVSPPTSPKKGERPTLERFYSAQSSFGSHHEDMPSSSHSNAHPPVKQSRPVTIARKMTIAHSAGAAHSILKAVIMTPTQFCAGAAGCVREKVHYEKLKKNPKATQDQIQKSKKLLHDQHKHMLKAPVGELITGMKNTKEFIHKANQNKKAISDLKKQELRQNIVNGSTRTTNGMDRFSDQAWKETKKELRQHSVQQWKDSGHIMKLGATGKDSEFLFRR